MAHRDGHKQATNRINSKNCRSCDPASFLRLRDFLELKTGFEPATFSLARRCSTTEPLPHCVTCCSSNDTILCRHEVSRSEIGAMGDHGSTPESLTTGRPTLLIHFPIGSIAVRMPLYPAPRSSSVTERLPDSLVTAEWLADHLSDENIRVVDIRGYVHTEDLGGGRQRATYSGALDEYLESHIPGSVFVDWTSDITDPNADVKAQIAPPDLFRQRMEAIGLAMIHRW